MAERNGKQGLDDDFFVGAGERDGVSLVRDASRATPPKRFYKDVAVDERDGHFVILLDGRPVRTPRQQPLALPTRAAAEAVAAEWAAQGETIRLPSMHLTRLVNTALDGVANEIAAVAADIVKYAGSDLVCYRASEPPSLVDAQANAWDPILIFARENLGADMRVATGIVFVVQTPEAVDVIARAVERQAEGAHAALRLAALHTVTTLTGSALVALALEAGALSCADAWRAAHVDEDEQMRIWGFDADALRRRAARFAEMQAACDLLAALPTL